MKVQSARLDDVQREDNSSVVETSSSFGDVFADSRVEADSVLHDLPKSEPDSQALCRPLATLEQETCIPERESPHGAEEYEELSDRSTDDNNGTDSTRANLTPTDVYRQWTAGKPPYTNTICSFDTILSHIQSKIVGDTSGSLHVDTPTLPDSAAGQDNSTKVLPRFLTSLVEVKLSTVTAQY